MDGRNPWWKRLRALLPAVVVALSGCGEISLDPTDGAPTTTQRAVFAGRSPTATADQLVSVQLDGSDSRELTATAAAIQAVGRFAIAPDGSDVAFLASTDTGTDLFSVPVAGGLALNLSAPMATGGGGVTSFQWAPDSTRLAFRSASGNTFVLHTVRPNGGDGTLAANLFNGSVADGFQWAPDSSRLAFLFENPGLFNLTRELYTVTPDGTALALLSPATAGNPSAQVTAFAWAPDSSRVGFLWDGDLATNFELFTSPAAGQGLSPLIAAGPITTPGAMVDRFAWAPDSQRLAYRVVESFAAALLTTRPAESASVALTAEAPVAFRWSPDAGRLAYSLDPAGDGTFQLQTVAPDGAGLALVSDRLTPTPPADPDPLPAFTWAPTGEAIAYIADAMAAGVFELFASAPDGSAPRRLSALDLPGRSLRRYAWSPDGTRIAYIADQRLTGRFELFVTEADGSANRRVSEEPMAGGVLDFLWASDNRLVYRADQAIAGQPELYAVEQDGSGLRKLSDGRVVAEGGYAVTPP